MPDGQVVFEITGDNRPVEKVLKDTTDSIERESKKWDAAADASAENMTKSFSRAFDVERVKNFALKAAKALVDFGMDAIQAASDLQEVQNVVDVTFGDGASQIEKWAKTAGTQFGLTETQAKKFTSTLGAMMKSAGLAGPEIVSMSTDLAGLAADMASFYNLDFETAFQKIRSGISGETEPLKQLGINMSVANLEAYALTQGITKAFDKMSQGEQTMLRYQYLMQATADAQGDFARTSDGYANAVRQFQTNLESLKANVGVFLLDAVNPIIGGINDLVEALKPTDERTILDDFADMDFDLQRRISEINETAAQAQALVGTLASINAPGAKNPLSVFVSSLASGLGDLGAALGTANKNDYAGTLETVSQALSVQLGGDPAQWRKLLNAISDNLPDASDAARDDNGAAAAFLTSAGQAAASLGGDYSTLWGKLLGALGDKTAVTAIAALADSKNATAGQNLADIAKGANDLGFLTPDKWSQLFTAMGDSDVLTTAFGDQSGTVADRIKAVADSLKNNAPTEATKGAWEGLLGTLYTNSKALAELTGLSESEVKGWLGDLASQAATLKTTDIDKWNSLFALFTEKLPGTVTAISDKRTDLLAQLVGLQETVERTAPASEKVSAWTEFFNTLSGNKALLAELTGESYENIDKWLADLGEAANTIEPDDAEAWKTLLDSIGERLTGLTDGELGASLADALSGDNATSYLTALGYKTEDVADKQKMWLEVCRQLVQTIPGLNEIINTETGEIDGGIEAVKTYVDEWQKAQEKMLAWKAYYAKADALNEKRNSEYMYRLDMITAEQRVKRLKDQFQELGGYSLLDEYFNIESNGEYGLPIKRLTDEANNAMSVYLELENAQKELDKSTASYNLQVEANAAAVQYLKDAHDGLVAAYGEEEASASSAASATSAFALSTEDAGAMLDNVSAALKELNDYYATTREATAQAVDAVVSGFSRIVTPAEQARQKFRDLHSELAGLTDAEIDLQMTGDDTVPTIENMTAALEQQLDYINRYQENLAAARANGVSEDILALLSDGSAQSADYLAALAKATNQEQVAALNARYAEVQTAKGAFTDTLTEQKLAADEQYDAIKAKAEETVNALNMATGAEDALYSTVEGMATGIAKALPDVTAQVNAVLAEMERLNTFGGFNYSGGTFSFSSGASGVDYSALGDTIRSNTTKTAGNVYLDGQRVGDVIAKGQASRYVSLERSGLE